MVSANVYGGQIAINLSGTGTPAGAINLSPASVDFGPVDVGIPSAAVTVEATNESGQPVTFTAITVTGPFSITANGCGPGALAAGQPCPVNVEFTPTQSGACLLYTSLIGQ